MAALDEIKKLYEPRPYHNFGHALNVWEKIIEFLNRGIKANEELLYWSALLHDAGYGQDFKKLGFISNEHMHAQIAFDFLLNLGKDPQFCQKVAETILATNPHIYPQTTEQKLLRAADLSGLAADFSHYREFYEKIKAEFPAPDDLAFFRGNLLAITPYFWPMIRLTDNYYNQTGASDWHSRVANNIITNYRLIAAENNLEAWVIADIGSGINPVFLWRNGKNQLSFGIEPERSSREGAQLLITANAKRRSNFAELIAPGISAALPLPTGTVNEIILANVALRNPQSLCSQEFQRILIPNGKINIYEWYSPDLWCQGDTQDAKLLIAQALQEFELTQDICINHLRTSHYGSFQLSFSLPD